MKRFVFLAIMSAAMSTVASAAACTGGSFGLGFDLFSSGTTLQGGTGTISCTVAATAGNYLTNVAVHTISDLTNGANTPSFLITLSVFGSSGNGNGVLTNLAPATPTVNGTQVVSTGGVTGNTDQLLTSITLTFSATSALLSGTADATSVNANGITGANGTAAIGCVGLGCSGSAWISGIFFDQAPIDQQTVPEPATLSLVGGALIALGAISRRARK